MGQPSFGSLLVLTEDGASAAHATVVTVLKRMLQLVVPDCQTHRLGFETKNEAAQRGVQGTGWKDDSPKHYAARTMALRAIATKLGRENGFVFFHIDADRTWSERATSENIRKFETAIVGRVRQLLQRPGVAAGDVEMSLRRLLPLIPCYSIEAWLFQHTEVAIRLCREKYQGRDVEKFEAWRRDRTALDDVARPKDVVCLKSAHNLECAGSGFPAHEVFSADRSYAESVRRLRTCSALEALLRATTGRP